MRFLRALVLLGVGLVAVACGGASSADYLTAGQAEYAQSLADSSSDNYDPGVAALDGYSAVRYFSESDDGPQLLLIKCGDHPEEDCVENVDPTVEAPRVHLLLENESRDDTFDLAGKFILEYPNAADGSSDNRLYCRLRGDAPSGVIPGRSGLWEGLLYQEVGDFATTQDYEPSVRPAFTKQLSDGSTWRCNLEINL